jgi:peptide deformylase
MAFAGPVDKELTAFVRHLLKNKKDGTIPIVEVGDPVLRQPWNEYTGQISARVLRELIPVMRETMLKAPGVGLAAPQVGIPLAFAVVEDHLVDDDDDGEADDSTDAVSTVADENADETAESVGDGDADDAGEDDEQEPYDWSKDPRDFADFPFHVIINPHYEPISEVTASFYEGCLSLPGVEAVRRRWHDIHAVWQDEKGVRHEEDLHGWPARIFQHETDHLSGEIYIDKAEIRSISTEDNMYDYGWSDPATLHKESQILGFSL